MDRPAFDELPLDKTGPPGNAWGLYGADDALGALNLLTPAVVAAAAASEIRTGERVSLDWFLDRPVQPSFGRPAFAWRRIVRTTADGRARSVNDDHVSFNTQGSSQWDGFRHYGYQGARQFYGGRTMADFDASDVLGIDAWVTRGGIVGRGVLVDYASWAASDASDNSDGRSTDALASTDITVADLEATMAWQGGPTLQTGDILFVRSGFTAAYEALSRADQRALAVRPEPEFAGLAPTETTLRWLWRHNFAAVAGDAPSFERARIGGAHTPVAGDPTWAGMAGGGLLHQWVLAGWGVPIGELFDLEELATHCATHKRYSFFLSSVPLKVPGGVASPPNAIAIF